MQDSNSKLVSGFGSVDCSVHLNTPPSVFPLNDPLCDGREEICDEMFISGTPFLNFGSLSCSFTPVQVYRVLSQPVYNIIKAGVYSYIIFFLFSRKLENHGKRMHRECSQLKLCTTVCVE